MGKLHSSSQILFLILFVFSAVFTFSQSTPAKCAPTLSIDKEFNRVDTVFVGEVKKKEPAKMPASSPFNGSVFTFSVEESFKGEKDSTLDVKSFASTAESYFNFKEGEKYLVYAEKASANGDLTASGCSRTKIFSAASEDIIGVRLILYSGKKNWLGITPAVSNRAEVERLFGECESGQSIVCSYETDLGDLLVSYNSRNLCDGKIPEVSEQKVLSLTYILKNDIPLKNIPLDLKRFTEENDSAVAGLQYLNYEDKTLILNSIKNAEKAKQFIYAFRFLPSESQMKILKCAVK